MTTIASTWAATASPEHALECALEGVHPSWKPLFTQQRKLLEEIFSRLASHSDIQPPVHDVFAAYRQAAEYVSVVIIGQDPYPTAGHAMGLSFSIRPDITVLPRSLRNIFLELSQDLGILPPTCGDLTAWHQQGVMLLNRTLTVATSHAGSHQNMGWDAFTTATIEFLACTHTALVGVCWGKQAQQVKASFAPHPVLCSAHPSPLSARRGFFGSQPFSRINELLLHQGKQPIYWQLPGALL